MGDVAIGIDLGTTYCCVAVYRDSKVEIIPNSVGINTTPSYVHMDKDNSVTAGTAAKGAAVQDPTTAIYDVKRLQSLHMIGRRFNDPVVQKDMKVWPFKIIEDEDTHFPRIILHGTSYLPEQISAHVLEYLKKCGEEWLNCPVKKAVITVPAYFTEAQRHATKLAGAMAGLEVLNLLHEPTAAAVFYCYKNRSFQTDKTILVFDLGGGTFDVVVMTIKDRKIQIKAIGGDSHLGGQDIDRNLIDHCLQEFKAKNGIDLNSVVSEKDEVNVARMLRRVKTECEEIKTQLSYSKKSVISLDSIHGDTNLVVPITREEFDKLNDCLYQQCVSTVRAVVEEAKLTPGDIDEVIMVGGSSRIPRLQELVMGLFQGKKANKTINADEAVACGAAIQAALMTTNCAALKNIFPDIKIRDAVPSSVDTSPFTTFVTNIRHAESVYNVDIKVLSTKSTPKTIMDEDNLEFDSDEDIPKVILGETNEVEKPDEMAVQVQIIASALVKTDVTETISGWKNIYYLTEKRYNCEGFVEHGIIGVFLKCLHAFPYERYSREYSILSLINIAKVKKLRPQLMTSELIKMFYNLLDSTEENNLVSYGAAWFIIRILSDGATAWTIESPPRAVVLSGIRRSVKRWEVQSTHFYYETYFGMILRLMNVTHTTECQLFAAWSLKNYTKGFPEKYVPMLVKEGGLDILNKMKSEDEDLRKFVNMTLKQSTVHSRYKSTL